MNLFKTLWTPTGLESVTSHIGDEDEAYAPEYGNRRASERVFGKGAAPAHDMPVNVEAATGAAGRPRRGRHVSGV